MKVLYAGHTYTVRANHAKIAALARLPNMEIALVTPHAWRGPLYANRTDAFESTLAPNVRHHILRAAFTGKESAYLLSPGIGRIIKEFQPDIIHVEQGAYALSYAQILRTARKLVPQARAVFFTWWNIAYKPRGIKQRAEAYNFSHSACAIAGNSVAKDILRERGFSKPIHILPQLGIDLPQNGMPPRHTNGHFRIGYAGRIDEEKGVLDLVHAAAKMQRREKTELYFVGAGNALERAKREAAEASVALTYHPAVRNEELPEHLAMMDALVLPSRTTPGWVEQFGHILLEAMAAGVPVIGSSSGEIPNVIGTDGIIFQERNVQELASALDRLSANPNERRALAENGYARVRQHFTHDAIACAQKDIYDCMIAEGEPVGSSFIQ